MSSLITSLSGIQSLISSSAITLDTVKNIVLQVKSIIDTLLQVSQVIAPNKAQVVEILGESYQSLPKPNTLEDLAAQKPTGPFISNAQILDINNRLAQAVRTESWTEGFFFALQLLAALGAI